MSNKIFAGIWISNGIAVWADEQTIREIYLKPFEVALKTATSELQFISDDDGTVTTRDHNAVGVMSSFNRIGSEWAGGSEALMTTVLREEWGFNGIAITDFNLYGYMYPDQAINASTDLMLTFPPMNGIATGATVEYTQPVWRTVQIGIDVLLGLLLIGGAFLVFRRVRKHRDGEQATAPAPAPAPAEVTHTP